MAGRLLLPKAPNDDTTSPAPPPFKRYKRDRVAIACERCRVRKIKCNGSRPTCKTCRAADSECRYADPDGRAGGVITELQTENHTLRKMLDELRQRSPQVPVEMLPQMQLTQKMDCSPDSRYVEAANLPSASASAPTNPVANIHEHLFRKSQVQDPNLDTQSATTNRALPMAELPISRWTRVSIDDEMLTHLFTLFWTWDNTVARIIHWGLFVEDMCAETPPQTDAREPPRHQFCSEFLINAMLAAATIYDVEGTSPPNCTTQGRVFADEALRLLEVKQQFPSLPYLQGVALLWAYEETLGNPTTAAALLVQLFELHAACGFFQSDPRLYQVEAVKKATRIQKATTLIAWGFYGLDAKISLSSGHSMRIRKPMFPKPYRGDETSNTGFDSLNDLWFPYPVSIQPRLSYHKEAIDAECEFAELAEQALLIIEEGRTSPVPDYVKTKSIYNWLITRKSALLGRFNGNSNSLPTKVFLQISFDMLAIKLLEPFTRLSFLEFDGGQPSQSLSFLHSDSVISALWNYRAAFGMRHEYCMIQACQVAAMVVLPHLSGATTQAEMFRRSCELLHDVGKHLPLANHVLSTLKAIIAREGIEMPSGVSRFIAMAGKADRVHINNVRILGVDRPLNVAFDGEILKMNL
ncbi:hypothetical protein EDB81DRAFT_769974 [Dactylonectria macrodidyma]|uniref:Zn(2)-C6 fungal-type domain-containing protein n=1 Tax=Dactylonectria macrodidyma TaxID=307937 RepID=A0A9P9FS61_9HYPO|nr:hypothetical protein EDB81DRAFT_769974 [Dactylonectria macrodidyma]